MKICVISTSALPAPPSNYGGLEAIAYYSAQQMAMMGNSVVLLTTNESTAIGSQEVIDEEGKVKGTFSVVACGPTSWSYNGERDMFLNYHNWLETEFGDGQGVIIDHTWWGYPYYSLTGGIITLDVGREQGIVAHPKMKLMHVIHGVTGWQKPTGEYAPPQGVLYPRILGVSKSHAQYLTNCFGKPVRHVFNGVKIPEELPQVISSSGGEDIPPFLLSLNRISKEKGIHNSIDVCLATKTPLKVVGDDVHVSDQKYVFEIMDKCARSGGLIEYVGTVDNDKKWEYIRGCKALICCPDPSNYVESFYMAAVEGWSQGKPILSLRNGGLSDTVVDGVNGFLADNVEMMKEILTKGKEVYLPFGEKDGREVWEKQRIKLEHISHAGITAEENKYTIENMAKGYLDLCQGVERDDPSYRW